MRKSMLLLLLFICLVGKANEFELPDTDEVTIEELKLKSYDKDTSAIAVYLFNIGEDNIEYVDYKDGFVLNQRRRMRIKILKEEGIKEYADFIFNCHKDDDLEIEAYVFNLDKDGEVEETEFDDDEVKEEEVNEGKRIIYRFSLPKVKVGSVIDVEYSILRGEGGSSFDWKFQKYVPIVHCEYKFTYPEYYSYQRTQKGYEKIISKPVRRKNSRILKYNIDFTSYVHEYVVDSIPAFESENFMLAASNYISRVDYELSKVSPPGGFTKNYSNTWQSVNNSLIKFKYFGGQLEDGDFLDENFSKSITNFDELTKAKAIYKHIQDRIKWDDYFRRTCSDDLDEIYEKQTGNSADINLMLVATLRHHGIKCYPVILSTRGNGIIYPTRPTISDFNYVVAAFKHNDEFIFLDATEDNNPFGQLPYWCLNDNQMRLISKKHTQWVKYKDKSKFATVNTYKLTLDNEGNFTGNNTTQYSGYSAFNYRENYEKYDTEDDLLDNLEKNNLGLEIEEFKVENIDSIEKNIKTDSKIKITGKTQINGDKIFFNPLLFEQVENSPFKLKDRKYPIDFGTRRTEMTTIQIKLPEDYEVEQLPKRSIVKLPNNAGRFMYTVRNVGQNLIVSCIFQITKKQLLPNNYQYVKQFYNIMIEKEAEMIVLKKKSEIAKK
jgi:hypothetical protein